MRIRVFEESNYTHYGRRTADWQARCDCGDALHAGDWEACMTWACGHLVLSHPRRPLRPVWEISVTDGTHQLDVIGIARRTA